MQLTALASVQLISSQKRHQSSMTLQDGGTTVAEAIIG
jgi:hypothetical protein